MMATMDLSVFLLARIAEDEAVARKVVEYQGNASGSWSVASIETFVGATWLAEHIARWQPTRVLAECKAKRRIVEFMANEVKDARRRPGWTIPAADLTNDVDRAYRTGVENQKAQQLPDALDRTDRLLRLLALPYADHPDYREEWRP